MKRRPNVQAACEASSIKRATIVPAAVISSAKPPANLGTSGWIAAQLVCDDLAGRFGASGQYAFEKAFRRGLVAAFLKQDVKLDAVLLLDRNRVHVLHNADGSLTLYQAAENP